jgi:hypothetical protein
MSVLKYVFELLDTCCDRNFSDSSRNITCVSCRPVLKLGLICRMACGLCEWLPWGWLNIRRNILNITLWTDTACWAQLSSAQLSSALCWPSAICCTTDVCSHIALCELWMITQWQYSYALRSVIAVVWFGSQEQCCVRYDVSLRSYSCSNFITHCSLLTKDWKNSVLWGIQRNVHT